jgi:hypothetical protein
LSFGIPDPGGCISSLDDRGAQKKTNNRSFYEKDGEVKTDGWNCSIFGVTTA